MNIQYCDFCGTPVAYNYIDHTSAVTVGLNTRCACRACRDNIDLALESMVNMPAVLVAPSSKGSEQE